MQTAKEDGWIGWVSCRNWLTSSVLHIKTNVSTAREIQQDAEEGLEMFCSNV